MKRALPDRRHEKSSKRVRLLRVHSESARAEETCPYPKRVGSYSLTHFVDGAQIGDVMVFIAKKDNLWGIQYFTVKMVEISQDGSLEESNNGKKLIMAEYEALSVLAQEEGVVRLEEMIVVSHKFYSNELNEGVVEKRFICLVLDCYMRHPYDMLGRQVMNLQHYVIKNKRLSEDEALPILLDLAKIMESLHKRNVVHRDIKLGNIVLNTENRQVTLCNFCLAKKLENEEELIKDQCGSPAYISPDVLSGQPYKGKPADMWSLGVVFYTVLIGQFPFYDNIPQELIRKIQSGHYSFPTELHISVGLQKLISGQLHVEPNNRLSASETVRLLHELLNLRRRTLLAQELQVVPILSSDPPPDQRPSDFEIRLLQEEDRVCISLPVHEEVPVGLRVKFEGQDARPLEGRRPTEDTT